jgi:hypothetical protein
MRNLSIRCGARKEPGQELPLPRRSSAAMSFSWLFLGGMLSSRARLRFTNRGTVCSKLVLPVEEFTANGELPLNCLSHPRGQAQTVPFLMARPPERYSSRLPRKQRKITEIFL